MPRAKSSRARNHEAAIPSSRQQDDDGDLEMGAEDDLELEDASAHEDGALDGTASASGTSANTESTSLPVHRTKKDKKKSKREALMQRLVQSSIPVSPYSKSHQRREKRKEKQSLKLGAITAALEDATPVDLAMVDTSAAAAPSAAKPRTADLKQALDAESRKLTSARGAATGSGKRKPTSPGKIGEDTAQKTLSAKQRQKMLTQEKTRLPAILSHKSYAASPFETLRLHAQNTIVPLEKSRRP